MWSLAEDADQLSVVDPAAAVLAEYMWLSGDRDPIWLSRLQETLDIGTGIGGFPPLGGAEWHALTDSVNSVVRVEVAYHGQAKDAGRDLRTWLSDFWTGQACPPDTPISNVGQPHCLVYFAATHLP